jgi:hypothetical protein
MKSSAIFAIVAAVQQSSHAIAMHRHPQRVQLRTKLSTMRVGNVYRNFVKLKVWSFMFTYRFNCRVSPRFAARAATL